MNLWAYTSLWMVCLGCGTYLVVQGHPWFALLVILCGPSVKLAEKE